LGNKDTLESGQLLVISFVVEEEPEADIPRPIVKLRYPSAKKPTPAVIKNRILAPKEAIEYLKGSV
jgi:hypothetical protein